MSDEFNINDLDSFESDFDSLSVEDKISDGRTPAKVAKEIVSSGLRHSVSGIRKGVGVAVSRNLPMSNAILTEAGQFGSSLSSMKNDIMKDLGPTIATFKQISSQLLPKTKGIIPDKLYTALQNKTRANSSSTYSVPTQQERIVEERNSTIKNALSSVFQEQEKKREAEGTEARVDKFIDRKINALNQKDNITVLSDIREQIFKQTSFSTTSHLAYLKKSIELKYKHLFVAKDTLAVNKLLAQIVETKLEEIKHNTALPDIQKQHVYESLKTAVRGRMGDKFTDFTTGFKDKLVSNVKKKIGKGTDGLKESIAMVSMAVSMQEAMGDMGGGNSESIAGQGSGALGGLIGKAAGTSGGRKVLKKVAPILNEVEANTSNLKTKALLKLNDLQGTKTGLAGFLLDLLPKLDNTVGIDYKTLENSSKAAVFSNTTNRSIIEVIPGYLAKILKRVTDIATGTNSEELAYDVTSKDFVGIAQLRKNLMGGAFLEGKAHRTYQANSAISLLNAAKTVNTPDDKTSMEDHKKDMITLMYNLAHGKKLLDVTRIEAFAASDLSVKESGNYVQLAFRGIKSPKEVAALLVSSLKSNGKIDKITLTRVNNHIMEQMGDDKYRDLLPSLLEGHGYQRHLKDMIGEQGVLHTGSIIDAQLESINLDEVDPNSNVSYADFLVQQRKDLIGYKDTTTNALNRTKRVIGQGKAFIGSKMNQGKDLISSKTGELTEYSKAVGADIKTVLEQTIAQIVDQVESKDLISESIKDTTTDIGNTFSTQGKIARNLVRQAKESAQTTIAETTAQIKETTEKVTEDLRNQLTTQSEIIHSLVPQVSETGELSLLHKEFTQYTVDEQERSIAVLSHLQMIVSLLDQGGSLTTTNKASLIGKVGSGIVKGMGNSIKTISTMYAKSIGGLYKGGLNLGASALNLGSSAIPGLLGMGNTALSGGLGLAGQALGLYGDLAKGVLSTPGKIMGSMFGKKRKAEPFVNVYRKDEVDPGKPILSRRIQQQGVIFQDGTTLANSADITEPVFDAESNEVLITQEDIDHGLVNVNNEAIQGAGISFGTSGGSNLFGKLKGIGKLGLGKLLGGGGGLLGLYAQGLTGLFGAGKNALKFGSSMIADKFGGKKTDLWREQVLQRFDTVISRLPKPIKGDKDGDGDRDGSYQDQISKSLKRSTTKALTNKSLPSSRQVGGMGLLGMLGSKGNSSNSSKGDDSDGIMETGLKTGAGLVALNTAKKYGGKALVKMGLKTGAGVVGSAALSGAATSGIGASVMGGLGAGATAVAGTLAAIPVAGWIALGTLAVGAGAYAWYKSSQPSKGSNLLLTDRIKYYGLPTTIKLGDVRDLEDRYYEIITEKKQALTKSELESFANDFGVDVIDQNQMRQFIRWYTKRFVPLFGRYIELIDNYRLTYENMEDIEEVDANFKHIQTDMNKNLKLITTLIPPTTVTDIIKLSSPKSKQRVRQNRFRKPNSLFSHTETDSTLPTKPVPSSIIKDDVMMSSHATTETAEFKVPGNLLDKTKSWIKGHEGLSLTNYKDTLGYDTIGYGHLNKEGYSQISKTEADQLFDADFSSHVADANRIPEFGQLDPVRQAAMIDLTYNMGASKLMQFKNTRSYLDQGDYDSAAAGLLNSRYATQVKGRANEVAEVIKTGDPNKIRPRGSSIKTPTVTENMFSVDSAKPLTPRAVSETKVLKSSIPDTVLTKNSMTTQLSSNQDTTIVGEEYGKQQVGGLNTIADKLESLKELLSSIFGTGEVFNEMNAKLQASVDKEPVTVVQGKDSPNQSLMVQNQQTAQPRASKPTINLHKTKYATGGVS